MVSLGCAYLALVPQVLCVVYATLAVSTREAEVALALAGQLACEALNLALKRLIKEARPRRRRRHPPPAGYGMPSSHAQFVAFWSLSLALFLLVRHRPRPRPRDDGRVDGPDGHDQHDQRDQHDHDAAPWSRRARLAVSLAALALAALVAWSRVYLGYHSPRQVLAGALVGALCAAAWFAATALLRRSGWLAWVLDTRPAAALRLRDLAVHEDVCQAGWEKWRRLRPKPKTS